MSENPDLDTTQSVDEGEPKDTENTGVNKEDED